MLVCAGALDQAQNDSWEKVIFFFNTLTDSSEFFLYILCSCVDQAQNDSWEKVIKKKITLTDRE